MTINSQFLPQKMNSELFGSGQSLGIFFFFKLLNETIVQSVLRTTVLHSIISKNSGSYLHYCFYEKKAGVELTGPKMQAKQEALY